MLVEVAEPRLATDLDELAAPSSGGRPRRSVADQAQAVPGAVRDRLASPERRLVRFGAVLGLLAVASALYFWLTSGLSPLDALSYAICC